MTEERRVRLNARFIRHMLAERDISARELASKADMCLINLAFNLTLRSSVI